MTLRRSLAGLAIFSVLASALILAYSPTSRAVQTESTDSAPLMTRRADDVVGMGGCSAVACHGAVPSTNQSPASENAYTVWITRDPHARAYQVLHGDLSARMIDLLNPDQGNPTPAYRDSRCLTCHATPELADDSSARAQRIHREGVSCEACHGPAKTWLGPHTTWRDPATLREEYDKHDMRWLNSPAGRAETCVGCHVGAPPDEDRGLPARAVTHDFIAAGHPRLSFDFATYFRALPPHWCERDRTASTTTDCSRPPEFALDLWLAGQVAAARAELDLLAWRASPRSGTPWPELAEYDCFSCHHNLKPESWRQQTAGFYENRVPGSFDWNSWYWSAPLRQLMGEDSELGALRKSLAEQMSMPFHDRDQIVRVAKLSSTKLKLWNRSLATAELLVVLRPDEAALKRYTWDDAAQLYLALRTFRRAGLAADDEELAKQLDQLRDGLMLPRGEPKANSPVDFRVSQDPLTLFPDVFDRFDEVINSPP